MVQARGLLLDIGGVVLRSGREMFVPRARSEPALRDFVTRTDLAGPGDDRWRAMIAHEITERDYWEETAVAVGRELGEEGWRTRDLIVWLYHAPQAEWLVDEMVDLMDEVRGAGLRLAALTNDLADFHGQDWVDQQRWLDLFDVVVDGSVTGVLKPDPAAYRLAVDAMGLAPEEIVYLDDMPVNVRGATVVGLQALEVLYADRSAAMTEARRRLGLIPALA